jgi:hypothetical protein
MKSDRTKFPTLTVFAVLCTMTFLIISGCQTKFDKLVGKVYIYEDSVYTFTAGFDKDTLYYIMKDAQRPYFHRSQYKTTKVNDSTFVLELTKKPAFWQKNTWEIVIRDDKGFESKESKNYYKLYLDSVSVVKKAF